MTKQEEEFLEKNFKAGEYSLLQLMVRNEDIGRLLEILKSANMNLAVIPSAQASIDFASEDFDGREH